MFKSSIFVNRKFILSFLDSVCKVPLIFKGYFFLFIFVRNQIKLNE